MSDKPRDALWSAVLAGAWYARVEMVKQGWTADEITPGQAVEVIDALRADLIRAWERGEEPPMFLPQPEVPRWTA